MSVEIVDIVVSINMSERGIRRLRADTSRSVHVIDVDARSKCINPVLMNLIGNAVKFTASGHVRVNCSVEESISAPGEVNIKFEIWQVFCCNRSCPSQCQSHSDSGIGLSAADVELLFVPFQQADVSIALLPAKYFTYPVVRVHPLGDSEEPA